MKVSGLLLAFLIGCVATLSFNKTRFVQPPVVKSETMQEAHSVAYGETQDGQKVTLFKCVNENGLILKVIDYGATVVALETPDRDKNFSNIILTCPNIQAYEANDTYIGSTIGRYCNRIAKGKFSIDGQSFQLATNDGENHSHRGLRGWDKTLWDGELIQDEDSIGVRFQLTSLDGDEGYPGTVVATVEYRLTNNDELIVDFWAETDQPTHVNLTNHNYWNLGGQNSKSILNHELKLVAENYLPVDESLVPSQNLVSVEDSPFDFREFHTIGQRIEQTSSVPDGYDHCFAFDGYSSQSDEVFLAAVAKDPESGRVMEIHTTQPGAQFYTGNFLDGSEGSGGYELHRGFCLKTQHFPNSPNQSEFPSTLLMPGEKMHERTIHRFYVEKEAAQ